MLEKFKIKPSAEKLKIISENKAWSEFSSQFYNSSEYDHSDLRRIFELYHISIDKHKAVLMSCLAFKTDTNQLQIELLKTLYNAKRKQFGLYFVLVLSFE